MNLLENIRIVLVNTQFAGNIGAAARAMKNMGLSELYLVSPTNVADKAAYIRAASATDIINNAIIVDSLQDAIADCKLVIGTSTRDRGMSLPALTARECGEKLVAEAGQGLTALVFGQESSGLQGADLQLCNFQGYIPANPAYASLNLGAAVQTFSYEIFQAASLEQANHMKFGFNERVISYPDNQDMEYFYQHLEKVLLDVRFIVPQHPGQIMQRLRRLFNRTRPDEKELKILRGVLAAIERERN